MLFPRIIVDSISEHLRNETVTFIRPFLSILVGTIQKLVARHTKYLAFSQLRSQGDDVVIEKSELALVPSIRRVLVGSSALVCFVHFVKEALVPFLINVPVLHGVGHIRCLDDAFDCDGRFAVPIIALRHYISMSVAQFGRWRWRLTLAVKRLLPTNIAKVLYVFIENIRRHHTIHDQLAASLVLVLCCIDTPAEIDEFRFLENRPGQIQ
mmetsp:Transcript_24676/g.50987  ORF Transcript_24676/g.50987 Transcript_24676/m.50987 type:complete len:210 (+) Transcript_24676:149-778(+)